MDDFSPVWEALNKSHVLLLVDTHQDPANRAGGGYDIDFFETKVEQIYDWFKTIVKDRCGKTDFRMVNDAWLCVRPLLAAPAFPQRPNMKIMVLR